MYIFTVCRVISLIKTALPKLTGEKGVGYNMLMCMKLQKVIFSKPTSSTPHHLKQWSAEHIYREEKLPTTFSASDPLGQIFNNVFIPSASEFVCVF